MILLSMGMVINESKITDKGKHSDADKDRIYFGYLKDKISNSMHCVPLGGKLRATVNSFYRFGTPA